MIDGDERLRAAVQKTYDDGRAQAAAGYPPELLPMWEQLPPMMQIIMTYMYLAGRRQGAEEERKRGTVNHASR
jgi:hypothetical protein